MRSGLFGSLLFVTVFLAGCRGPQKQPPPLQPPALSPSLSYRAGGPFALPATGIAGTVDPSPGEALTVRMRWMALAREPESLRPLLADATLIAAPRSAEPFLAAGQLARGAGIVPAADLEKFIATLERGKPGDTAEIAATTALLPPGVTASFAVADDARRIELDLYRLNSTATTAPATTATTGPSERIQISLALDETGAARERVVLPPRPVPPGGQVALVLPWRSSSPQVTAIAAIIEFGPPSDSPDYTEAVAEYVKQLKGPVGDAPAPQASHPGWPGLAAALQAVDGPANARVAMVYLARETGAELFGDAALVASDATLFDWSNRIRQRLGEQPSPMAPAELGWVLDRVALEQLAALQAAEKLPPDLVGVLARHAGEAARNAGSLEELSKAQNREQLQLRLITENFTYLEDASPSARVRAYDWLKQRGRAPAKYDPLAPAKERSAAMDAALSAGTLVPETANTPGGAR